MNKLVKTDHFHTAKAASQELRTRLPLWRLGSSYAAKK